MNFVKQNGELYHDTHAWAAKRDFRPIEVDGGPPQDHLQPAAGTPSPRAQSPASIARPANRENRAADDADSGSGIIGSVYATLSDPVLDSILIVDDDEGVTETFAQMLRLQGYVVRTALTAETGLLEAAESQPGAIILDLCMPCLDGLGFLRRLRQAEASRATPVAIVTADYPLDDEISAELHALGAELRFKPLWLEDLVDLARDLLKVTH